MLRVDVLNEFVIKQLNDNELLNYTVVKLLKARYRALKMFYKTKANFNITICFNIARLFSIKFYDDILIKLIRIHVNDLNSCTSKNCINVLISLLRGVIIDVDLFNKITT